jgi:phospholipase C
MDVSAKIKRVFVLMLENRSFDHVAGYLHHNGIDPKTGLQTTIDGIVPKKHYNYEDPTTTHPQTIVYPSTQADYKLVPPQDKDPGHEFDDTLLSLCGPGMKYQPGKYPPINNSGFVNRYKATGTSAPRKVMDCFDPNRLPVFSFLAQQYAACDRWFSSMPGPTWPNRLFIHAGSSAYLDDSPPWWRVGSRILWEGYEFEKQSVFEWLDAANIPWIIYEGDSFPQVFSIKGMNWNLLRRRFRRMDEFAGDIMRRDFEPQYIFIEPNYGNITPPNGDFSGGNSQHPLDDMRPGERLIKHVYDAILNSPYWCESLLLVTYDEHGGFYDHVHPPKATPPGDQILQPGNRKYDFDFSQLGVRVPTAIVSPWIPTGTIDHTTYDHSSLLKTLRFIFPELQNAGPLTDRIEQAEDFSHLFSLPACRQGSVAPDPVPQDEQFAINFLDPELEASPIPPNIRGFLHVAFLRHQAIKYPESRTLIEDQTVERYEQIRNLGDARRFLNLAREEVQGFYRQRGGQTQE